MLTLGSLFDGIGGWLLAAQHAGIKPLWRCEIDEYPRAVSEYHFHDVDSYGDIRKIRGNKIAPVDIICAGSPCQNLSMAGNRKGLQGSESSLFYESIRILKEMRNVTNGKYPRFFVWENVTGAFSSNHGNDFRAVLSEIGQTKIPMPKSGRWATCGMVRVPLCDIAWRTLDAQYWGVPQRRRRIFLVADFAESNRCAAEILFVEQGMSGDLDESSGKEQNPSDGIETGTSGTGDVKTCSAQSYTEIKESNSAATLRASVSMRKTYDVRFSYLTTNKASARYTVYETDKSRTLNTQASDPAGQQGGVAIVENIEMYDMAHADEVMRPMHNDKVNTLNSRIGTVGNQVPVLHNKEICRVRRLTPTECERLQGLPDGYTDIEFKGKPASDARRYKAIGNGMAQPCADFVLQQIIKFQRGC